MSEMGSRVNSYILSIDLRKIKCSRESVQLAARKALDRDPE